MEVTEPMYDEQEEEWVVEIIWMNNVSTYAFNERSDADSFYRTQQVQVEQINEGRGG